MIMRYDMIYYQVTCMSGCRFNYINAYW